MDLRRHRHAGELAITRDRRKGLHQRVELEYAVLVAALVEGKHHPIIRVKLPQHVPQADDPLQRASQAEPPLGSVLDDLEHVVHHLQLQVVELAFQGGRLVELLYDLGDMPEKLACRGVFGLGRVCAHTKRLLGGFHRQVARAPIPQDPVGVQEADGADPLDVGSAVRRARGEVSRSQSELVQRRLENFEKHFRGLVFVQSLLCGGVVLDLGIQKSSVGTNTHEKIGARTCTCQKGNILYFSESQTIKKVHRNMKHEASPNYYNTKNEKDCQNLNLTLSILTFNISCNSSNFKKRDVSLDTYFEDKIRIIHLQIAGRLSSRTRS